MKTIFHRQILLGILLLLPNVGCVNPFRNNNLIPPLAGANGKEKNPRVELPKRESAELCLALAKDFESKGLVMEAIYEYRKPRHYNPRLKKISRNLADLYSQVGEHKLALQEFKTAVEMSPRDADLRNNFGYFFQTTGKWAKAEEQYAAALELNPHHRRAWTNLGLVLAMQNRYEESLEAFKKNNSPGEAYSNLAFVLTTQGKREEAKELYSKAIMMEPDLRIPRLAYQKLEKAKKVVPAKHDTPQGNPETDFLPDSSIQSNDPPRSELPPVVVDPFDKTAQASPEK